MMEFLKAIFYITPSKILRELYLDTQSPSFYIRLIPKRVPVRPGKVSSVGRGV